MDSNLTEVFRIFDTELYQRCSALDSTSNIILSSFSVLLALTLTLFGAHGNTEKNIKSILNYDQFSDENLLGNISNLLNTITEDKTITIANKMYLKANISFQEKFKNITVNYFNSEIENINFDNSKNATNTINSWVESQTNKKITNMISRDMINSNTRLIIINAIHFKSDWLIPFHKNRTILKYWTKKHEKILIPFMHNEDYYRYGEIEFLDAKVLELEYNSSEMSMFIVLPNKLNGLSVVEEKLKKFPIQFINEHLQYQTVFISIPKFQFSFDVKLKEILIQMGMSNIFSDNADFSKMLNTNESISVGNIVHKAFIEINEESTEAAASTVVEIDFRSGIEEDIYSFDANHPFYFYLWNRESSTVVFSGRVTLPNKN